MKEKLNAEFELYLSSAYGSQMLSKCQKTEIKLAFTAGLAIAFKTFTEIDTVEQMENFQMSIREIGIETNNNR